MTKSGRDPVTSKKRILIYSENYLAGGTERCIFDLANHLDRTCYAIALWVNRNPHFGHGKERLAEDVAFRQIRILATGPLFEWLARLRPPRPLQFLFKLVFVLLRYPVFLFNVLLLAENLHGSVPDILQVINGGYPGGESCQAAVLAAKLVGVPHIFFYSLSTPFPVRIPLAERLVDRLVAQSAGRMIFNSKAACMLMEEWRHINPEQLVCIYSGSWVTAPSGDEISAARQWVGVPTSCKLIGEVAALEPHKGQHILLQAAPAVIAVVPEAHFVFVGQGDYRQRLEDMAHELGLEPHVTFAGFYRGNIYALMSILDVVTLPTFQEGLPYVIEEAMAMGKPIVATPVGGISEQVLDGESALLVPPGDAVGLASALQRVLTDREFATYLGRQAQKRFINQFSLQRMIDSFQELYRDCKSEQPTQLR